ncbi:hypothetical protein BG011_000966, partial [Mortierella polycephala]
MQPQKDLMLTRRQKTLSSISNYIPLHILLNRPVGVSFSLTAPKSFTIEQLARQIEAEYAYLVEREVGHSRFPVIQCGALFDHIELRSSSSSHRKTVARRSQPRSQRSQQPSRTQQTGGDSDGVEAGEEEANVEQDDHEEEDEYDDDGTEEGSEGIVDERDEAESRGVQLRFSDKVEDVLDRDSTVHVVNIDQGIGMGRKLSLTNLALAVGHDDNLSSPSDGCAETGTAQGPNAPEFECTWSMPPTITEASCSVIEKESTTVETPLVISSPPAEIVNAAITAAGTPLETANEEDTLYQQQGPLDPRASTFTTDTVTTLLAPASTTFLPFESQTEAAENASMKSSARNEPKRPMTMCSIATEATATSIDDNNNPATKSSASKKTTKTSSTSTHQRSRATDILLNLESSSNDARFQEILHNTIALDHFRQFCFQEYSIENLLFWMDVELFAKPSPGLLQMDHKNREKQCEGATDDEKKDNQCGEDDEAGQFAVQHARYIYLTYIDACAPLQVNLSDETRTDIPWPILDYETSAPTSASSSVASSPTTEMPLPCGNLQDLLTHKKTKDEAIGWPLDRRMFDGAQEHTYQLMKGHTLVRFEDSDLWKAVEKIIHEQPEEYAKATIQGPFNSYYRPLPSVILSTVTRSRSRHPSAKPQTLYNWNNSTSDLDRSRDKEEALVMTMSQYFGPIPASIRHPARVILGLGRHHDDDGYDDGFEDFDTCGDGRGTPTVLNDEDSHNHHSIGSSASSIATESKRYRFKKHLSNGIVGRKSQSNASDTSEMMDLYGDDLETETIENGQRTTRWMVAGYFNDQVRLTAAQRKRLLRRNNKLTKFFGSRVDGTLRPVEETGEGGFVVSKMGDND